MKVCIYCKELINKDHSNIKCIPKISPEKNPTIHKDIDYSKFTLS